MSAGHALTWDGKAYMPVGLRIEGIPATIGEAQKLGATDFVVDLPASGMGWKEAFATLEASHSRYLLSLSSLAPMAKGFAVEPEAYRITNLKEARTLDIPMPGCESVLVVLITKRDSDIQKLERVPVTNGVFHYEAKPLNDLDHTLFLYPQTSSLETPDCWEGLDAHRDHLLAALKQMPPGPGLRGIVNPAGQMVPLHANDLRFVPSTPYFQVEFRAFLEAKYHSVDTLQRTWGMRASGIEDFETMSRLVPLWSAAGAGIGFLWDPKNDHTYQVDQKRSRIWGDLREIVAASITKRFGRLVNAVKSVANVPVIQEWAGWSTLTEGTVPLDGIGMQASGSTPSQLANTASRATSSILRWDRPGWLVATRIRTDAKDGLANTYDDLTSLGARGCFFDFADAASRKVALALPPMDLTLMDTSPTALFFPENAANPAVAQRLPFGRWWLPSPASGNRIDLGTRFFGYRMDDGPRSGTVLWTSLPPGRYKLHLTDPSKASFVSLDGSDVKPKVVKDTVEITMTNYPVEIIGTDEIPIPDISLNETNVRYNAMLSIIEGGRTPAQEERYLFAEPLAAFDRNPGGSFAAMRYQYQKVATKIANYTWIEGESTKDHNFSGNMALPECSNGGALILRNRVDDPGQHYIANYTIPAKTGVEQEVWVAAKIPAGGKAGLQVVVAGQLMNLEGPALSPYGSGFAWYKLGTTRLSSGTIRINVIALPDTESEIAIDAILLYPGSFNPSGVVIPDPVDFETLLAPKKKKGH